MKTDIKSFDDDGTTHVVTWGKTKKDCEQAAAGSKRITTSLGITTKPS